MNFLTLRVSLRKGRYVDNIQWYSTIKALTAWENLYVSEVLGMGNNIYSRSGNKFMNTACPILEPWFGKFMIVSKLRTGVMNNQYFGLTSKMVKNLLMVWYTECKREVMSSKIDISCLTEVTMIGFCGVFRG